MDSFEFNKIAGALLAALLMVVGLNILVGDIIFAVHKPEKPGFEVAVASAPAKAAAPAAAAVEPIGVRLAAADAAKGQAATKQCASCHSFEKGGTAKVGPNLYDIVERKKGSFAGFKYSAGMTERGGKGEGWTYDDLDTFLTNPKGFVSGTTMSFAGVSDPVQRANIIAYLRAQADAPKALPAK